MTEESVVLELSERTNAILAFVNSRPQTTPIDVASEPSERPNGTSSQADSSLDQTLSFGHTDGSDSNRKESDHE